MFDAVTAQLLRSAPEVPGLNPQDIPALFTAHYANLASARLRGARSSDEDSIRDEWPLERIADTYELITSIHSDAAVRRSAAFVAGTAQQILARKADSDGADGPDYELNIDRDYIHPAIAAALLFLAAEQYADANEAAAAIIARRDGQSYEATILSECIVDFAQGRFDRIQTRAERWRRRRLIADWDQRAFAVLLEALIAGLEILAARFMNIPLSQPASGRFLSSRDAFERVLQLSASSSELGDGASAQVLNAFAGVNHLASLLLAADDATSAARLTSLVPPVGSDSDFWQRWLRYRAASVPYVWPNHREAIAKQFHQTGRSAVVVLPTGAGKTTVSSLKIAGVLARGKKVIFLAPTHALVEQLTDDLQQMFPADLLGATVSSDFDQLFLRDTRLKEIEVMTPERCLATLSFLPEVMAEVGLLVFDECHLLSPGTGKVRRALDGMLCVLGFCHVAPDADLLFLSAMLRNSQEFADWLGSLTGRPCVSVELLWKPSRQARGVLVYKSDDLKSARQAAWAAQVAENKKKKKEAKGLRAVANRLLLAQPWSIWGLQHNWLSEQNVHCIHNLLLNEPVLLTGDIKFGPVYLKPNANHVAARVAVAAAKNNLKTIIFVNTKHDAVVVASEISATLGEEIETTDSERERWRALETELGNLKHSLIAQGTGAVPHNSSMLRLERDLAERTFKRANGAKVIVATPTLAQGLNLPAHFAILAGDKRADPAGKGRAELQAHEILNAAARAGRAGHLANGVVLLIPEPIISFSKEEEVESDIIDKLKLVLPEDDRCVQISDPIEIVLDRLMQGSMADQDVRYIINRMVALREADGFEEPTRLFDLRKSMAAFVASRRTDLEAFNAKVAALKTVIAQEAVNGVDDSIAVLASQSGLSLDLLARLRTKIAGSVGKLPTTIEEWLNWTVDWLAVDEAARTSLLHDVAGSVLGACGKKRDGNVGQMEMRLILPGLLAWVKGQTIADIEKALGGNPQSSSSTLVTCPRARDLVGSVVPRGFSFVMGLLSHIVKDVDPYGAQENLASDVIECLGVALRKGLDSPEKVKFSNAHPEVLSRVQLHHMWSKEMGT